MTCSVNEQKNVSPLFFTMRYIVFVDCHGFVRYCDKNNRFELFSVVD